MARFRRVSGLAGSSWLSGPRAGRDCHLSNPRGLSLLKLATAAQEVDQEGKLLRVVFGELRLASVGHRAPDLLHQPKAIGCYLHRDLAAIRLSMNAAGVSCPFQSIERRGHRPRAQLAGSGQVASGHRPRRDQSAKTPQIRRVDAEHVRGGGVEFGSRGLRKGNLGRDLAD